MLRRILFAINLLRAMPAYCAVCLSGAKKLICAETEGYMWFLETYDGDRFFLRFAWLMWRYDCYRSHVVFRCSQASAMCSYLIRLLYPPKKDMELLGQIGEGLVIYHGHGTVIAPYSIGKNFSVYQGVTIGRNAKPGREINNPIIGDNVTVFTNAVVAGGITIGDNVTIGAGAVVMKDVPATASSWEIPASSGKSSPPAFENTDTYETSGCHTTAGCQRVKNLAEESRPQAANKS